MRAFFCEDLAGKNQAVTLSAEERKHIFKVLRAREGDQIILLDGKGKTAVAKIANKDQVFIESIKDHSPPDFLISLFVAVPRHSGMDQIISYASETNVSEINPIICDYSVAVPEKTEKWQKKIIESCKQSKNPFFPKINPPLKFDQALKKASEYSLIFFGSASEGEENSFPDFCDFRKPVSWFVGPEGGFSEKEIDQLHKNNAIPLKLSPYIMRVGTAAIAGIILLSETFRRCQRCSKRLSRSGYLVNP